jgi:hypothetical protein
MLLLLTALGPASPGASLGLLAAEQQQPPSGWKCRCANQSLCAPLRTPKPDQEVFAYYEDDWTRADYNQTWRDLFSGGTVTTIAACEGHAAQEPNTPDARMSDEHLCYAHARGVRVVAACVGCDVWSGSPGALSRCPGHTTSVPFNFNDSAARATYVANWSAVVHERGYDGLSLDMEGGIPKNQGAGLTALVCEHSLSPTFLNEKWSFHQDRLGGKHRENSKASLLRCVSFARRWGRRASCPSRRSAILALTLTCRATKSTAP